MGTLADVNPTRLSKGCPLTVIIEGKKEWEVEKIFNKRKIQGKNKYLV